MAPKICRQTDSKDPRHYRERVKSPDLFKFQVALKETDLLVSAEKDLTEEALAIVWKYRNQIEKYIAQDPQFKESLVPHPVDALAPPIVKEMAAAGREAGVGPMAAVAGAMAEFVGRDLMDQSPQIIVENGGDIFLATKVKKENFNFYGEEISAYLCGLWIDPRKAPLGICTSSGVEGLLQLWPGRCRDGYFFLCGDCRCHGHGSWKYGAFPERHP